VLLAQLLWQPAAAQLALDQYPLDWVAINATNGTSVTKDLYGDGCACSLLNGTCTPNCCCDYNCLGSVRQRFYSDGTCLFNETQVDNLAYCTEQGFSKVRLRPAAAGQTTCDQHGCVGHRWLVIGGKQVPAAHLVSAPCLL
jgi:hypothetical protein